MASVAEITPISSEFDMPANQAKDAVTEEISKIAKVIESKVTKSYKAATQAVIGDVPKMIDQLTKEIESGPVDSFANAMNKLISLVDKLGINLRDYNDKLADTVNEFKGTQEQVNEKLSELRQNGIKAEYNQKTNGIKFLTKEELKIRKENLEKNEKIIAEKQAQIKQLSPQLGTNQFKIGKTKTGDDKLLKTQQAQENYLKRISKEIVELNEENEKYRESLKDETTDTGGMQGFSQLGQLKEAFMVIPDTIAEVFTTFKDVGTKVFGGIIKAFEDPIGAFKSIGGTLKAIGGIFTTARALIALKVMLVVAAIQFFAEKIESIGAFFVGVWEKITGFFQGIVDWFKNSAIGKFFGFGGKDEPTEDTSNKGAGYGTAASMGAETDYYVDNKNAPVRNMTSATLEDGLVNQTVDTSLADYDDNSAKIMTQQQLKNSDGLGTQEIDYSYIRGGTSLSQLGIKNKEVVGNQLKGDNTMYGGVSESLKELNAENAAVSSQPNIMIQNNSNVNSNSSSGTTVSGFVDHEPDTSFKYIRSGATGSDQF